MSRIVTTAEELSGAKAVLILEQNSLGYYLQGLSGLEDILDSHPEVRFFLEVDERIAPLAGNSFFQKNLHLLPFNARDPSRLPLPNNGKPETQEDMLNYYNAKSHDLAKKLDLRNYAAVSLLRPEAASPFNAHVLMNDTVSRPGYLYPESEARGKWIDYLCEADTRPMLISWNKQYSQHGDAAQQNLDPAQVAELLFVLHEKASERGLKLDFYNAVHGIGQEDLEQVNSKLPDHIQLHCIKVPGTDIDFDLGQRLDDYAACMGAVKDLGGGMIGVGNTYQHLFYAVSTWHHDGASSQVVVVPHGDSPVRKAWEVHASQIHIVEKSEDFPDYPSRDLERIAEAALDCLPS